jgi:DNA-binding transcriptional LysR family regulator
VPFGIVARIIWYRRSHDVTIWAFDALLVARENLGVLLESAVAARLVGPDGVRLDELGALLWVGFPRSASPASYDEVIGVLGSHGIDIGPTAPDDQELIAAVKFTAVSGGHAFALAPENQLKPLPDNVRWAPLVGRPLVRRTWVVWPANSRRPDIGYLIASFELPNGT